MKILAERLKELRTEKGLTVRSLASATGLQGSAISRWENNLNNAGLEELIVIAKFFGVTTDYLLGLED